MKKKNLLCVRLYQRDPNRLCWMLQYGRNRLFWMLKRDRNRLCWLSMKAELLSVRLSRLGLNELRW